VCVVQPLAPAERGSPLSAAPNPCWIKLQPTGVLRAPRRLCRASDVQVELVMLDPYVRTTLTHDGAGRFSTQVGQGAGVQLERTGLMHTAASCRAAVFHIPPVPLCLCLDDWLITAAADRMPHSARIHSHGC